MIVEGDTAMKYACPCCGKDTLDEPPPGTYAICPVCNWEDDRVQFEDPTYKNGANHMSLTEARESYYAGNIGTVNNSGKIIKKNIMVSQSLTPSGYIQQNVKTNGGDPMLRFLQEAAQVKPSSRQLAWYHVGFYAFIHFGPNTFTDREWGLGSEEESIFDPVKLDCDQWVEAIKSAGMKGMVLTAKHHDGFCLWPSKYTEHSVKNSPFQGDIVKEAAAACKRGGIQFGVYLSPWDRNSKLYGTPEYNDYFCHQLTELLTEYGPLFYVWFDNACGEGPNGKKQIYDFPRYIQLIRQYQPDAVIFNDFGPDVRWCGNEAGKSRYSEWAVIPGELCPYAEVQSGSAPLSDAGDLSYMYNSDEDIGALHNIIYSKGLAFVPSEINMSIRPGWFWHECEEPHSMQRLYNTYMTSVGSNACFHLNLPPNRDGLIDERDVTRLKEFGQLIEQTFGQQIPATTVKELPYGKTQPVYTVTMNVPDMDIRYIVLSEDIRQGQRVESFRIIADFEDGHRYPIYQGTTIGYRKICQLIDPYSNQNPLIASETRQNKQFRIHITSARDEVFLQEILLY